LEGPGTQNSKYLEKISKHEKCQKMQKHSVTGVHGSDQRGYDCDGISAAICLLTCLLWQIVALAHCASSSMSVMNRVNKKARGAAANNVLGIMPSMFPGQMVPQMMQMGLPRGSAYDGYDAAPSWTR
jgi:hypothetical protein